MKHFLILPFIIFSTFILKASPETILNDKDSGTIERRRAFFELSREKSDIAGSYLNDKDPEIRRYALYLTFKKDGKNAFGILKKAMGDSDEQVRLTAIAALTSLVETVPEAMKIINRTAKKDSSEAVRQIAEKYSWPFSREIRLLRNDPEWDHEIVLVKSIDIPDDNWKFMPDKQQDGHIKKWFGTKLKDASWGKIKCGHWESQGYPDYNGIAWYRIKFRMPEKIESNAVELHFEGVDESAWVWLNGVFLGCHDIGESGWNIPFDADCTQEIKWNAENLLVVRVRDTNAGGGIWKPITVNILK